MFEIFRLAALSCGKSAGQGCSTMVSIGAGGQQRNPSHTAGQHGQHPGGEGGGWQQQQQQQQHAQQLDQGSLTVITVSSTMVSCRSVVNETSTARNETQAVALVLKNPPSSASHHWTSGCFFSLLPLHFCGWEFSIKKCEVARKSWFINLKSVDNVCDREFWSGWGAGVVNIWGTHPGVIFNCHHRHH